MQEKIIQVLETIRPALQADGGDVEFVAWRKEDGCVQVKLKGACAHCMGAVMTLKNGIEVRLMEEIPEVKFVERVE